MLIGRYHNTKVMVQETTDTHTKYRLHYLEQRKGESPTIVSKLRMTLSFL